MTDFAGDSTTELQRKAKALSVVSLIETCSYLLLFYMWQVARTDVGTAIVGSFHGFIWLSFCAMVLMLAPALRWTWGYCAVVIITGPIGALMVWYRLRREGIAKGNLPPERQPAS